MTSTTSRNRGRMKGMRRGGVIGLALAALVGCGTAEDGGELAATSPALVGSGAQIGVFRSGTWLLDTNGDNVLTGADTVGSFGQAGDFPLVSKLCNPTAQTRQLFVTRGSGQWFSTANDFDWNGGDQAFSFGLSTGTILPAMLSGHIAGVVSSQPGGWFVDRNDDHAFTSADLMITYGGAGDSIVAGRWGSSPAEGPGTFHNGLWTIDSNFNWAPDGGDAQFWFGDAGDFPAVGDFNVNHAGDEIAVFRSGTWFVDFNGNRGWDGEAGGDKVFSFGQAGDIPVVANPGWRNSMCFP